MGSDIVILLLLLLFVWSAVLSFFFLRQYRHHEFSSDGSGTEDVHAVLTKLSYGMGDLKKHLAVITHRCDTIEKDSLVNIKKIGLVRFNPFKDTGGEQSFIIALTDSNETGIVISNLYSRSGSRWYAKRIIKGKSVDLVLSDEEKRAIKEAKIMV